MAKWADFCITKVRYNNEHSHIVKVIARPDNGDNLGSEIEFTRAEVVKSIENGTTFITATMKNGNWQQGEDVRIVVIHGTKYIRTDQNRTENDNLGSLPEY